MLKEVILMPSNYDQITKDNIRRRGEEFDDIGHLISEQLYSDRSHFVYELLQNAEDALERRFRDDPQNNSPCGVKFLLFKDRLEFRHFGQLFNENNVKGISDVLKGTKSEDSTQIGKFGIGFKSVYAFTATPQIHSGDEHFVIERYIRPKATDPCSRVAQGETLFIFPFNHKDLSEGKTFDLISNKLRRLGPRILLFLNWINEIEWRVEPNGEKGQYLKESQNRGKARQMTVIGQNNAKDEEENWLVFDRSVPVPDGGCTVKVEVAFKLKINGNDQTETITKIKDSPLVVYFPTKIDTRFGFLVQGPYDTVASRSDIEDNDWNKALVKEIAVLLTEALRSLKEMGLLTVALLEALPIRMDDFPEDSLFIPIVEAVRDALMNEELLPTDDDWTFVSARNARLASAEWLRRLLREEQFRQLFKTENPLKWISGEITEKAKHDLWKYICEELKVEEVTPDSFARKIDGSFLEKQTDDWMIAFYSQLVGQKALWKAGSNSWWDKAGPLRAKEFLRLQDGSHVRPFRDDDSPNAYLTVGADTDTTLPIVRLNISQHEEARKFLKELVVPELDVVEEVIERILPKYDTDSSQVSIDEHRRDLAKIEQAYKTDSQEKKHRLKERLRATPFILTEKPGLETTSYQRPTDAYFRNDELMAYFSGSDTTGFINQDYSQSMLAFFTDLGASDGIRISSTSSPGSTEFVSLKYSSGYRRGLRGFDPDIHVTGLEHALMNISVEKSEIIWNKVAVQYSHCIKGKILRSSRQDFSPNASTYKEEETISNFGQLLMDNTWLPRSDGAFVKPSELSLDDLPESFICDEKLADQLGMKKDVLAKLAEQAGIQAEDIELMRQHPEEFKQWKASIAAGNEKPVFPTSTVTNPERRQERLTEQIATAPDKEYEERERSVRTTRATVDPALWLRNQYTNEAGQMVCQICKEEMPFRKRDGEYYFEAVEALSKVYFSREHEAQFLAMCPLCAARYKEFVKQDEDAMETFKNALMNSDEPEVSSCLGDLETSVRFVESHFHDIKTILGAGE
jgi:hypothetical protein